MDVESPFANVPLLKAMDCKMDYIGQKGMDFGFPMNNLG